MKISNLSSLIEQHRPLTGLSSLPFAAIDNNGAIVAMWFNYYLDQQGNNLEISIKSVFSVNERMEILEKKVSLVINTKVIEFDEPNLNEQQYLSALDRQFHNYNYEEMNRLISQAEISPLLVAYKAIMDVDI